MTGQVGRPGTGLHPLRGQNNVQGASDAGLIPMMFPDYQRVDNASAHDKFEALWGSTLDPKPGLTVVEIMNAVHAGEIRGMYIMGENPGDVGSRRRSTRAQALVRARDAGRAGHLPDRDRLSRRRDPAGVRVPREDRHVHQHRPAGAARPAGARRRRARRARISRSSSRWRGGWVSTGPTRTRAKCSPKCARRCRRSPASRGSDSSASSAVTYPCEQEGDPGTRVVFTEDFPTANGRARFVPAALIPAAEQPGQRLPVRADHRPPARALAHRQHDAAHRGARRDRAVPGRLAQSGRPGGARRRARRHDHGRVAPRRDHARRARRRRHAARRGVHPVLLSTRRRRTCSRIRCSIRSARFPSSSTARCA